MTSEVEQRPRLVTAGSGRQGNQWIKKVIPVFSSSQFYSFLLPFLTTLLELLMQIVLCYK